MVFGLVLAVLGGSTALGSVAGASELSDPIAQAEQPETEAAPSPSDSDDEIRLVMVLLIAVAVIALLGTFVYWVRAGDAPRKGRKDSRDSPVAEDTLS
ncbi:MAG: hypothetical protein OXG34_03205 [bacterium]|nr:hypothetical protein [bacterium]